MGEQALVARPLEEQGQLLAPALMDNRARCVQDGRELLVVELPDARGVEVYR